MKVSIARRTAASIMSASFELTDGVVLAVGVACGTVTRGVLVRWGPGWIVIVLAVAVGGGGVVPQPIRSSAINKTAGVLSVTLATPVVVERILTMAVPNAAPASDRTDGFGQSEAPTLHGTIE